MSDSQEFTTLLLRVALFGGTIMAIGAGGLYLAFRAFARDRSGTVPAAMIFVVTGFVLLCCIVLVRMAFVR